MCSIVGLYKLPGSSEDIKTIETIEAIFKSMFLDASVRGRDSAGLVIKTKKGIMDPVKTTGEASVLGENFKIPDDVTAIIANLRAEPTTEYVKNKTIADVQPYSYNGIQMVHNGTIANDKELRTEYGFTPSTIIDSSVIPVILDRERGDVSKIKGSLALAWISEHTEHLTLYKNYQPISLFYFHSLKTYFFCSYRSSILSAMTSNKMTMKTLPFTEMPFDPYSQIKIGPNGVEEIKRDSIPDSEKAIVIISGGLDSTTSAKIACLNHTNVTLCHFVYGCRAEEREIQAVNDIAKSLGDSHPTHNISVEILDLSFLKNLGGSTLIDGSDNEIGKGEAGAEFAIDWVPFRNGTMIALAAAYCDRHKIGNIYLGLNLEESGAYPDNTTEFYQTFNKVLSVGSQSRPVIKNPLGDLMKHEIVNLALYVNAPIDKSWSCYRGGDKPCGKCGPCYLRSKAFLMNGRIDPIDYEEVPLEWGDSKPTDINGKFDLSPRLNELMTDWIPTL